MNQIIRLALFALLGLMAACKPGSGSEILGSSDQPQALVEPVPDTEDPTPANPPASPPDNSGADPGAPGNGTPPVQQPGSGDSGGEDPGSGTPPGTSDPVIPDQDRDGIADASDNCVAAYNPGQEDFNNDRIGNACSDLDADGVNDDSDNCVLAANPDQLDQDGDQLGDRCDDSDDDGFLDYVDNCPDIANDDQSNVDGDGYGDACDPVNDESRSSALGEIVAMSVVSPFDGAQLKGHVYIPERPASEVVGTILVFSPYWGTTRESTGDQGRGGNTRIGSRWDSFLKAGYAFAAFNFRGSGLSEGCLNYGGIKDQQDVGAIIQALAAQPWSNGRVGMIGLSFDGWGSYLGLVSGAPALKAIVPVSGVIDFWSVLTRNGAPIIIGPETYAIFSSQLSTGAENSATSGEVNTDESHFSCPEYASDGAENTSLAWNGDRSPYWEERSYREQIAESDVAVLVVNGLEYARWKDPDGNGLPFEGEGHILQFEGLWDLLVPGNRQMLLGQWRHGFPNVDGPREVDDAFFLPQAIGWFDRYVGNPQSIDEQAPPPQAYRELIRYQDLSERWYGSDRWPPESVESALPLSTDRILAAESAAEAGERTFVSSFHTGNRDPNIHDFCTDEFLIYVSDPLESRIRLAGNWSVDLTLSSTLSDGNLAAFLYAIDGDGSCPDSSAVELGRALSDLRHWENTGYGRDFPADQDVLVPLRGQPFAVTVEAGQRLVLAVGGDASELHPEVRKPVITISTGEPGSMLRLPVVEGVLRFAAP